MSYTLRFCGFVLFSTFVVSGQGCSIANYAGNVSITNGGRICQKWIDQEPHRHTNNNDAMFPHDVSVEQARNYCRTPDGDLLPWCYTGDRYKRWQYCDQQICEGNGRCGGFITDESGTISSIDADNSGLYDPNRDCLWTFVAAEGQFIKFQVLTFDLEPSSSCEFDMLQVYEDTFTHGRYCGTNLPPVITSKSRVLYVRFYTDPENETTGFTASFSQVEDGLSEVPEEYVSGELICSADVDLMRYHGNVSATNSGNDRWEWKVFQNVPDYHFDVDGSKMLAKSYCRNIQVQPNTLPWCLSKLTNQIEYCHEQICKVPDVETTTTDTDLYSFAKLTTKVVFVESIAVSNDTTSLSTGGSTPVMQSSTYSTPFTSTEIESASGSIIDGNYTTSPWTGVMVINASVAGYHTTDKSTKSGGSEPYFELNTTATVNSTSVTELSTDRLNVWSWTAVSRLLDGSTPTTSIKNQTSDTVLGSGNQRKHTSSDLQYSTPAQMSTTTDSGSDVVQTMFIYLWVLIVCCPRS